MTYRIEGLAPARFQNLFGLADGELAKHHVVRVTADSKPGFPCRITLEDAEPGETLILLNHVSHDVTTPYRTAYAIYVREGAGAAATFVDETPPVFEGRTLSLRGFDGTSGQDVEIFAGNIPMNQVSHIRAPGYADMRLIMPEVIRSGAQ